MKIEDDYKEQAFLLIRGAYDLHVHSCPSHFERIQDDFEVLREAGKYGMAGIMLKNHYESTVSRAMLANWYSGSSAKAYGGIALNYPVGGLNPYAVECALKMKAAIVWMPTRDAENCLLYGNMEGDFFMRRGLSILNENGSIKEEVYHIMEIMKKYDACLATGHLSVKESTALCAAGIQQGVRMILTHPEWYRTQVPIEIQIHMAKQGVLIEKNWYNVVDGSVSERVLAEHLNKLPSGSVYLATDCGQKNGGYPVHELLRALESMLKHGVDVNSLRAAVKATPESIVNG